MGLHNVIIKRMIGNNADSIPRVVQNREEPIVLFIHNSSIVKELHHRTCNVAYLNF